jgi:peroxiredoxin
MAILTVSDKFPDFEFHTAKSETFKALEVIQRKQNTVFWILRYIGCTTCNYDVHVISERYQEFLNLDAQVFIVLQSQPETILEAPEGYKNILSNIICDPNYEIYNRFSVGAAPDKERLRPSEADEVTKLEKKRERIKAAGIVHGKYEGNELQLPALFIVKKDSSVLYAHYAKNIIDMPTVDGVLEKLKSGS